LRCFEKILPTFQQVHFCYLERFKKGFKSRLKLFGNSLASIFDSFKIVLPQDMKWLCAGLIKALIMFLAIPFNLNLKSLLDEMAY